MFQDESWKPIYFGIIRWSEIKVMSHNKTLPAWVFAVLWVLASCSFTIARKCKNLCTAFTWSQSFVKPRPYQQQCWSNIVEATGNFVEAASTPATMSQQHCRMLQVERFFRQRRMLLRRCCRFWQQCCRFAQQCRTKFRPSPFDEVETNWTCSICFDFVERTKFYNRIVRHCCRLWQQSRTLLRQCCLLLRHCCWCGRGLI